MENDVSQRAREAAADLARVVYGNRIANAITDGTSERHHFLDAFARFERDASAGLVEALEPFAKAADELDNLREQCPLPEGAQVIDETAFIPAHHLYASRQAIRQHGETK